MAISRRAIHALACAVCALPACSNTASSGDPGKFGATNARATAAKPGNACDRNLLSADDVAGILDKPVTGTKPLKGDAQTCYFITADDDRGGPELRVSLRPGLGIATIATFTSGKMDAYVKSAPLAGVGDGAVWKPDLHEVAAQKNDILCEVGPTPMSMGAQFAKSSETAQQQKLGALCNKIFAAY